MLRKTAVLALLLLLGASCSKPNKQQDKEPASTPSALPAASAAGANTGIAPAAVATPPGSPPPDGKYERVVVDGVTVPMINVMNGGAVVLVEGVRRLVSPPPVESGVMFGFAVVALIGNEQLYLKVDALTKPQFEAADCTPFRYRKDDEWLAMGYFSAPEEAMESPPLMLPWARLAVAAALRARLKNPARKAARNAAKTD